jgi:hypothetical protein
MLKMKLLSVAGMFAPNAVSEAISPIRGLYELALARFMKARLVRKGGSFVSRYIT